MIRNVMPLVIGARGLSQGKGRIDLSRPESFDGIFDPDSLLWRIDLEKWLEGTLARGATEFSLRYAFPKLKEWQGGHFSWIGKVAGCETGFLFAHGVRTEEVWREEHLRDQEPWRHRFDQIPSQRLSRPDLPLEVAQERLVQALSMTATHAFDSDLKDWGKTWLEYRESIKGDASVLRTLPDSTYEGLSEDAGRLLDILIEFPKVTGFGGWLSEVIADQDRHDSLTIMLLESRMRALEAIANSSWS